ncbi:arginine--tRNA ligase [Candidatus Pacearchaeota archaeon CG10_big_fil_rev_8_21_14_0_10_31_24]|nr:MAG: arginine--tRNA ligase [Candidatus Pacearchaeota archaeon CG10_big_fil_rev_8_21_14_0_10_31_24]
MKNKLIDVLKVTKLSDEEISSLIEVPKNSDLGDYAFPCFSLAKSFKKSPAEIAQDLIKKITLPKEFEKVEFKGPYLNFFVNKKILAKNTLDLIKKQKDNYGSSTLGKNKKIVIEFSSPNIAKPFGIGHLRSTIIGNSISNICKFQGYKIIKINYLGDWGTQFGKLITGYTKFGDKKALKENPIQHLLELYVLVNQSPDLEQEARDWFKKLEQGDKTAIALWKTFKELSLKEFDKIYKLLNVKFDVISGESNYNSKMNEILKDLQKNNLLEKSEGAQIVNLEEYGLGVSIIQKSDGTTLYATRDIATAKDRYEKYKFHKMIYEVGSEQKLHFKQFFKILELLGNNWAKDCIHIDHGLYLAEDGKRFSTRQGKTIFMADIFSETIDLAKNELQRRGNLENKELEKRSKAIALSAILYGDLKNYRANNSIFDINKFLSFEGDTGPYLLYTYARSKSILTKAKFNLKKIFNIAEVSDKEKNLITLLVSFPDMVKNSYDSLAPNIIANYAFSLAQSFNEFYHEEKVIGSKNEQFKLNIVYSFSQVLKNSLTLLGIPVLESM